MRSFNNFPSHFRPILTLSVTCLSLLVAPIGNADEKPKENRDILIQENNMSITKNEAMKLLANMSKVQKVKILKDKEQLQQLLLEQLALEKKVQIAKEKKLDVDPILQWKIQRSTNLILANALKENYKKSITVPDEINLLAKEHYDTNPEEFLIKERVKAAHILIKSNKSDGKESIQEKKELALKILEEVNQGSNFNDAAKKYSEDRGSAKSGGVLGYFSRGKMVKPFEETAFNLKNKNDISDLVETRFGFHIIKLLDHKKEEIIPYETVKNHLINKERKEYINKKTKSYDDSFNANKDTIVFLPAIEILMKEANKKFLPR